MFLVVRSGVEIVRPRGAFEVPGVFRVAPAAVEVAAGGANEDRGKASRDTFTLDGVKNFGAVVEFGELHGEAGVNRHDAKDAKVNWMRRKVPGMRALDGGSFKARSISMSIITGRGDSGETDLLFGKRAAKASLRMEALGAVDELNSALGLARASGLAEEVEGIVDEVQEKLIGLMGQLACLPEDADRYDEKGYAKVTDEEVKWLVAKAHDFEGRGIRFTGWARPGVEHSVGRAGLDVARSVARRAERQVWQLHESGEDVPESVRLYFNRLSDLLWILARADAPK